SFVRFLAKGSLKSHVFTISQAQSLEQMYSNFDKVRNVTGEEPNLECRVLFLLSLLKYLQINVFGLDEAPPFLEKNSVHVERIMDWVELNFRKPFSLEAIAQELHLSPYHISHLFKQHAGMTLSEYLTGRRIREACVLLENTDISISEIGRHIGGFSAPYFS